MKTPEARKPPAFRCDVPVNRLHGARRPHPAALLMLRSPTKPLSDLIDYAVRPFDGCHSHCITDQDQGALILFCFAQPFHVRKLCQFALKERHDCCFLVSPYEDH
jgi:hypothetical protein